MAATARQTVLFSLTAFLFLTWACLPVSLESAESEASEQELAQLNDAIDRIQTWLQQAQQNRPEVEAQLEAAERRLAAISQNLMQTRQAVAASNERLEELQRQQRALDESRLKQIDTIRQLVRAAYREGSQSTVKLLLNQDDPALAARLLYYYRVINEARLRQVDQYERTLASLAATEQALMDAANRLRGQQYEQGIRQAELEQERQNHHQMLVQLNEEIDQRGSELENLTADRDALQALIEEVRQAMESVPLPGGQEPFARRKGLLPRPLPGPLLSDFGERYGTGDLQRQGIVIGGARGEPVRAVHRGRVVFANWLRGSGLLIILDHGDGYMSLYGHNEALAREQGTWVEAGAVIATAGNSGGHRESGVYFEIRFNGRPQNPADWLAPESR